MQKNVKIQYGFMLISLHEGLTTRLFLSLQKNPKKYEGT